jgi:hypothetical protein
MLTKTFKLVIKNLINGEDFIIYIDKLKKEEIEEYLIDIYFQDKLNLAIIEDYDGHVHFISKKMMENNLVIIIDTNNENR